MNMRGTHIAERRRGRKDRRTKRQHNNSKWNGQSCSTSNKHANTSASSIYPFSSSRPLNLSCFFCLPLLLLSFFLFIFLPLPLLLSSFFLFFLLLSSSSFFSSSPAHLGKYDVGLTWIASNSRSPQVPIIVHHALGDTATEVNQQLPLGDSFFSLGEFSFANQGANNGVEIHGVTGFKTIIDAAMLVL